MDKPFTALLLGSILTIATHVYSQDIKAGVARTAADQGNAEAQYSVGELEYKAHSFKAAASWYRAAADQGFVDAEVKLGDMYFSGYGVAQDLKAAAAWYQKAANQNNAEAQFRLGTLSIMDYSLQRDSKLATIAAEWFLKAADQGHEGAQYNLGVLYSEGKGVSQNIIQAHKWFNLAAVNGSAEAIKARNVASAKMTSQQIAEAQKLAREWKPRK